MICNWNVLSGSFVHRAKLYGSVSKLIMMLSVNEILSLRIDF